jgi:hypothetical protein
MSLRRGLNEGGPTREIGCFSRSQAIFLPARSFRNRGWWSRGELRGFNSYAGTPSVQRAGSAALGSLLGCDHLVCGFCRRRRPRSGEEPGLL